MEGIDYAWDRPDVSQLKQNGKEFVCRYLAYRPNGKVIDSDECKRLHDAGIGIVLNWEQAAGDFQNGYDRGKQHAQEALKQANELGYPSDLPIYFSIDENVTSDAAMQTVGAYLNGVASVLGRHRTGVYGQYSVIERMLPDYAEFGWQTYAWSSGKVSSKAHIYQYRNGITFLAADVDFNRTLRSDFVAWFPGQTQTKDEEMLYLAKTKASQAVWKGNGIVSTFVADPGTLSVLENNGARWLPAFDTEDAMYRVIGYPQQAPSAPTIPATGVDVSIQDIEDAAFRGAQRAEKE